MTDQPINRDLWRGKLVEEALDPELPIVDAHHHVWPESPVPSMESYSPDALFRDKTSCGHSIVETVFVEGFARWRADGPAHLRPVGETEYADSLGRDADSRGGRAAGLMAAIVAYADMTLGSAVEEVLLAHRAAAPLRFRGVRCLVAFDEDYPGLAPRAGMLREAAFRAAMARLAAHGLSLDVWVLQSQLRDLVELARACPLNTIVIDHVGGPMGIGRYAGVGVGFDEWRNGLRDLAALPNTTVKLGGLNMHYTGLCAGLDEDRPWGSARMAEVQGRYLLEAIDLFSPSRCMFESNFPVDRMLTGATVLWNAFKRVSARFSPAERAELFAGTARRVYGLDSQRRGNA